MYLKNHDFVILPLSWIIVKLQKLQIIRNRGLLGIRRIPEYCILQAPGGENIFIIKSSCNNMISASNSPYSPIQNPGSEQSERAIIMSKTVIAILFRHFFFV